LLRVDIVTRPPIFLDEPSDRRIVIPVAIIVEPRLAVVLPAGEEEGVPVGRAGQAHVIGSTHLVIGAGAGDGGHPEAVVGDALGQEQSPEEATGLRDQARGGAEAVRLKIDDGLPQAHGVTEGVAVVVGIFHEGQGLIDPRPMEERMGLAVRGAGKERDDILLIVEVAGDGACDVLLDAPSQPIVAVAGDAPVREVDLDELVLHVIGVGRRRAGCLLPLLDQVPVLVVGVEKLVILEQAVGGLVAMES